MELENLLKRLFFALSERLIPRLTSSVTLLLLAAVAGPHQVGTFGWATLCLTALRAVTDQGARQVALDAIQESAGQRFLRRYQRVVGLGGPLVMILAVIGCAQTSSPRLSGFLQLLPLALVPAAYASCLSGIARLQLCHEWRQLARFQLVASVAPLVLAVPLLLWRHDLLGVSIQAGASECIFALLVIRHAKRREVQTRPGSTRSARHFAVMSGFSALGWSQGQADRVLVGSVAGTSVLGQYSLGTSLSRSVGDAVAAGSANVVRARLAALDDPNDPAQCRRTAESTLRGAMGLTTALALVTVIAVELVVRRFLGAEWHASLDMVAVLSLSTIPSNLNWTVGTLQIRAGAGSKAVLGPLVGVVLCLPIALGAGHSLILAAWLVLAREFCVVIVGFLTAGAYAPWRALAWCGALTLLAALFVQLFLA